LTKTIITYKFILDLQLATLYIVLQTAFSKWPRAILIWFCNKSWVFNFLTYTLSKSQAWYTPPKYNILPNLIKNDRWMDILIPFYINLCIWQDLNILFLICGLISFTKCYSFH
jgi:hypothetical protein